MMCKEEASAEEEEARAAVDVEDGAGGTMGVVV